MLREQAEVAFMNRRVPAEAGTQGDRAPRWDHGLLPAQEHGAP